MQQRHCQAGWAVLTICCCMSLQSSRQEDAEALVRLLSPEGGWLLRMDSTAATTCWLSLFTCAMRGTTSCAPVLSQACCSRLCTARTRIA
jgi:hypothetical protein